MVILLVGINDIGNYSINGYCGYFIVGGYWWIYFINGY